MPLLPGYRQICNQSIITNDFLLCLSSPNCTQARKHTQHLYNGTGWMNPRTIAVNTIGETKFARCDLHTVRFTLCSIELLKMWLWIRLHLPL